MRQKFTLDLFAYCVLEDIDTDGHYNIMRTMSLHLNSYSPLFIRISTVTIHNVSVYVIVASFGEKLQTLV